MSKPLYYSDGSDEICQELDYWQDYINNEEIDSLELIEMEEDKDNQVRWCSFYADFLENGDECGKHCPSYIPQNGVNGKCKYKHYTLKETKNKIIITREDN